MPDSPDHDPRDRPDRPTGPPAAGKAAVRAWVLATRRALPDQVRRRAAVLIQQTLIGFLAGVGLLAGPGVPPGSSLGPAAAPAAAVSRHRGGLRTGTGGLAAHVPMAGEPGGADLPAVLATALGPDRRLLLPVLRPDLDLDWAMYGGTLVPGPRGLLQPPGATLGVTALGRSAAVVVPALAVDRTGTRLGRGGGSYDRALARVAPGVPVVALLFDGELLDAELPVEPHDRRVTAVITPTGGLTPLAG